MMIHSSLYSMWMTYPKYPVTRGDETPRPDYKLVKEVVLPAHRRARRRRGVQRIHPPPETHYTLEEILRHFHCGAFSLVMNKMQHRWRQIVMMGRKMEEELGVTRVGANLYLTPMVMDTTGGDNAHNNGDVRQGFEAHWDWMVVIVIQLSGRKRWSVARDPIIYIYRIWIKSASPPWSSWKPCGGIPISRFAPATCCTSRGGTFTMPPRSFSITVAGRPRRRRHSRRAYHRRVVAVIVRAV